MRVLTGLLFASAMLAQVPPTSGPQTHTQTAGSSAVKVYVTSHGKVYHTWRDCSRLDHAVVLTATEADAEQHGLTQCKVCAHRHHAGVVPSGNSAWAQPEGGK
jgi:hypothetical protein